jgi:hypothetical protein
VQLLRSLAVHLCVAARTDGLYHAPPTQALHAAFAAAPQDFELVPRFMFTGEQDVAVYLLQASPGGGGRTRVTQPPAQTPEEAAYTQRLLAWLRQQDRWCCEAEVVASVPLPDPSLSHGYVRACVARHPDAVAVARAWRCLAAMRDGQPPGPQPDAHQMRKMDGLWRKKADAALRAELPRTTATAQHRSNHISCIRSCTPARSRKRSRSPCTAMHGDALGSAVQRDAAAHALLDGKRCVRIETVHAYACASMLPLAELQAEACAALLDAHARQAGALSLGALASRMTRARGKQNAAGTCCPDALREALAAAPHEFQLTPQFWDSEREVLVHLLREVTPGGARTCVLPSSSATPEEAAYTQRVLTWLRQQDRWCGEAEALASVPPPDAPHAYVFLRSCLARRRDAVAMASGWRFLAALRDGAPPGPPPRPQQRMRQG